MNKNHTIILDNPSIEESAEVIEKSIEKNSTIIIVGNCWVKYKGRASSRLEPGERIIIIKRDGALLIHRPVGYEPINWMPGGEILYHVELIKDEEKLTDFKQSGKNVKEKVKPLLLVKSIRRNPRETVAVFFDRIFLLSAFQLVDEGKFSLYASEEDMQRAIILNPSIIEDGFKPVEYEKRVEPGFVDVYGVDKDGRMVVIEIKRRTAGKEAVLQLAKYVKAIKASIGREVRGILAAPRASREALILLESLGLDFKRLDPRKCSEIIHRMSEKKITDYFQSGKQKQLPLK